jgi:hypothetical protein
VNKENASPGGPPPPPSGEQARPPADKSGGDSTILSWMGKKDLPLQPIWAYAALLFLLGAVGGMITAFYSVGQALPGIGGGGLIDPEVARMQAFEDAVKLCSSDLVEIQAKLKNCGQTEDPKCVQNLQFVAAQYIDQIKMYEEHVARLRDLVNANRWKIWAYGMPMYVMIGGVTSLLFAKDWVQALLFGYSWSGVVSAIGLKGAATQKEAVVQDKAQQLTNEIERLKQQVDKTEQEKKTILDWATKAVTQAIKQSSG